VQTIYDGPVGDLLAKEGERGSIVSLHGNRYLVVVDRWMRRFLVKREEFELL